MIIPKIVAAIILTIALVCVMYGAFKGIRNNDDKLTLICSISSSGIGSYLDLY